MLYNYLTIIEIMIVYYFYFNKKKKKYENNSKLLFMRILRLQTMKYK